tara:strand:+ start:2311 stop:3072 length:762 start_codon:yes stop_codon:yes gene_type:complete
VVTTYLQGGLGNYMFQIAAAHALSLDVGTTTLFNELEATKIHQPLSFYKDNIFKNVNFTNENLELTTHQEVGFEYSKLPLSNNILLSGYFQSEKYFKHRRKETLELFSPTTEQLTYISEKYGGLENTCSIHVRRGDYVNQPRNHPLCSEKYYQDAISKMPKDTVFLVFSDDIPFCKQMFNGKSFIFIENELDYIDMYIMSLCTNNIIANSTFSWWGAWLNKAENKVIISPSVWFGLSKQLNTTDIIPKEWLKL